MWTLTTPIDVVRENVTEFDDTIDLIRIIGLIISLEKRRGGGENIMKIALQYGLNDPDFVVIKDVAVEISGSDFIDVITTDVDGKVGVELQNVVFAKLFELGLIPEGA